MNSLINGIIDGVVQGKKEVYNPVFFYGDPIFVHLAIDRLVRAYTREHPKDLIVHTNGVDFVSEWIYAIKEGTVDEFKKLFCRARLLVFENVELIAGKDATMYLFFSIFDAVYESGGTIVLGGTKPPSQIHKLQDRVRAQMEGSLLCYVDEKR